MVLFFSLGLENSVILRYNKTAHLISLRIWLAPVTKSGSAVGVHPWTAGLEVHFTSDVTARARQ